MRKLDYVHIHLWRTERGTYGNVEIDGSSIGAGVASLTLTAGVGQFPILELNGAIAEFGEVDAEIRGARYGLSEATKRVLKELGWRPPEGENDE